MSDVHLIARALRKNTEELQTVQAEVERLTQENRSLRDELGQFTELNRLIVERVTTDLSSFERRMQALDGILAGHECALIELGADPEPITDQDSQPEALASVGSGREEDLDRSSPPPQAPSVRRASDLEAAWASEPPKLAPPDPEEILARILETARIKREREGRSC